MPGRSCTSRTRSGPPATREGCGSTSGGYPDFSPYARAAAEIAEPPEGFGVDELRLTDYVSANAALAASGHELWDTIPAVATPHGWTWHHVPGSRRLELVPVEVKALLRHHGGLATSPVDHAQARYAAVAGDPAGALRAAEVGGGGRPSSRCRASRRTSATGCRAPTGRS